MHQSLHTRGMTSQRIGRAIWARMGRFWRSNWDKQSFSRFWPVQTRSLSNLDADRRNSFAFCSSSYFPWSYLAAVFFPSYDMSILASLVCVALVRVKVKYSEWKLSRPLKHGWQAVIEEHQRVMSWKINWFLSLLSSSSGNSTYQIMNAAFFLKTKTKT